MSGASLRGWLFALTASAVLLAGCDGTPRHPSFYQDQAEMANRQIFVLCAHIVEKEGFDVARQVPKLRFACMDVLGERDTGQEEPK